MKKVWHAVMKLTAQAPCRWHMLHCKSEMTVEQRKVADIYSLLPRVNLRIKIC